MSSVGPDHRRVVLVTGANAGLGFELSLALARAGAHVVMACRSPTRAEDACARLLRRVPHARLSTLPLDLSEPDSIAQLPHLLEQQVGQLDVLIHNAGVFGLPLSRNSAGQEMHFATNYLGPFALTGMLLSLVHDAPGARVVCVGSLAHRLGKLRIEDPYAREGDYRPLAAYGRSKVALLSYTLELERRLRAHSSHIIAVGAHPGMAPTDIARGHAVANPRSGLGKWLNRRMESLIPSVTEAAQPILHAACAPTVQGGEYYGPGGLLEIAGAPARARVHRQALDPSLATQLWSASEHITGVRYLSR
ncbi:MAG: SDR family NAD(P)-dependent oxidoreductase [Myxococcales bacterium]|nr:SDR family NAD(P)-dependent oxidoreductase [Myxococcales bacterium]